MKLRRTPVIIDTDPGVDDALAILLALASPELEILAFIVSFGNTDAEASYLNIFKIYDVIARHVEAHPEDRARFPNVYMHSKPLLVRGPQGPIDGALHSAQYFHGRDGLGDINQRHPEINFAPLHAPNHPHLQETDGTGAEVALNLIRSHPARSITYVALGPLTNLARMLDQDRTTVRDRLGRVVAMGGALDVPGNTSPVAEFNFFADPYAVWEVLTPGDASSGIPLERFVLLPLDITTPHELTFPLYKKAVDPFFESTAVPSRATDKPPLHHFTSSFLERTREIMLQFGKDAIELHDIVAIWCAIENPPVEIEDLNALPTLGGQWRAVKRKFEVERLGEITRGMLVVDRRDDQFAYAPGANRAEVQAELERSKTTHGHLESVALPAQVEVEYQSQAQTTTTSGGIACVTETPGPEVLVQLMFTRIWGVSV